MGSFFYFFSVRKTTYNTRSHSYIPNDVISRHTYIVKPIYTNDSTVLNLYAILDHLLHLFAN